MVLEGGLHEIGDAVPAQVGGEVSDAQRPIGVGPCAGGRGAGRQQLAVAPGEVEHFAGVRGAGVVQREDERLEDFGRAGEAFEGGPAVAFGGGDIADVLERGDVGGLHARQIAVILRGFGSGGDGLFEQPGIPERVREREHESGVLRREGAAAAEDLDSLEGASELAQDGAEGFEVDGVGGVDGGGLRGVEMGGVVAAEPEERDGERVQGEGIALMAAEVALEQLLSLVVAARVEMFVGLGEGRVVQHGRKASSGAQAG